MNFCMTGTHGALRAMHMATASGSFVGHAVVLREKHRPTTAGFSVTTGTLTAASCALRAFLGRSRPLVATALPISAPLAAVENTPASTEPRPATRAKQVAWSGVRDVRGWVLQRRGSFSVRCVPLGLYSLAKASACETCDPGHSSTLGTDSCEACAPGRFSGTVSADSCLPCDSGRYSSNASSTKCTYCDIGQFADVSGANPHLWTTMREAMWNGECVLMPVDGADKLDDSGCVEGAWMSLDSQCYECGEGMLCHGLGKVILMEEYFAPRDNAGDVWKCHGVKERCPGGHPRTCAKNRLNTSLACGECEVGTRATTSGRCDECGSGELGLFVLVVFAFLVCLCVVYYLTATENRAQQEESIALIAILVSQIVTAVQVLKIFDLL